MVRVSSGICAEPVTMMPMEAVTSCNDDVGDSGDNGAGNDEFDDDDDDDDESHLRWEGPNMPASRTGDMDVDSVKDVRVMVRVVVLK